MKRSLSRRRAAIQAKPLIGGGGGAARFAHDPGVGKVLTGCTVYTGGSLVAGTPGSVPTGVADGNAWLDDTTGFNHLLKRVYYSSTAPNSGVWSRTTIQNYRNAGKIPSIAWHLSANATNIAGMATGSHDAAVTTEAQWAASVDYPIWTAFKHEPEDDFGGPSTTPAANYRAAYRRFRQIFRNAGANKVMFVGVGFQTRWTFEPAGVASSTHGGLEWWHWDPDWKGTLSGAGGAIPAAADWYVGSESAQDLMSHDVYCPTVGATTYRELGSFNVQYAIDKFNAAGRPVLPWVVLEWGAFTAASGMPAGGWTTYFQNAMRYMRDNNGVGYVYYNTDSTNFINADTAAARLDGYMNALASEASYLVSTRPPDEGVGGTGSQITFVGASVGGGNTSVLQPAIPTGAQAGDVALAFWTHNSASVVNSDPTSGGWTLAANNTGASGSGASKIFYKVLTGGDAGPTMTMSVGTRQSAVLVVYRGVNTAAPIDAIAVDTTHTAQETHNAPPVTTTVANCAILTSIHERATSGDADWTAGANYVERGDTLGLAVGSAGSITAVADNNLTLVASGTTVTPPDWTGDLVGGTANVVTYSLALRAA